MGFSPDIPLLAFFWCSDCRYGFTDSVTGNHIRDWHKNNYRPERALDDLFIKAQRERAHEQFMYLFDLELWKLKTVYDHGCGIGALASVFPKPYGDETDEKCWDLAQKMNGVEKYEGQEVDLTISSHSLEHLANPSGWLEDMAEKTRYIFIEVPNATAYSLERAIRETHALGHFHYFSKRSLALMLDRAGYDIVTMETAGGRQRSPWDKWGLSFLSPRAVIRTIAISRSKTSQ